MALAAVAVGLAGCAGEGDPGQEEITGVVRVLAPAALTDAFGALGEEFEVEHPQARARLTFVSSSELAARVADGSRADVVAAASPATIAQVPRGGTGDRPVTVFVRNRLQIAVPAANPHNVTSLFDLSDGRLTVALCASALPCGAAATKVFRLAGLAQPAEQRAADARVVLALVATGEVDAALAYRTDIQAAGADVLGIDFPQAGQALEVYSIVVAKGAAHTEGAAAFVELVLSPAGLKVLTEAGFEEP